MADLCSLLLTRVFSKVGDEADDVEMVDTQITATAKQRMPVVNLSGEHRLTLDGAAGGELFDECVEIAGDESADATALEIDPENPQGCRAFLRRVGARTLTV